MRIIKIKDLKKGEFFARKNAKIDVDGNVKESSIWIRGDYDRGSKTYSCYKYVDSCHEIFLKGSVEVMI